MKLIKILNEIQIDSKKIFYQWVKKHNFYHVSQLKNMEKILKQGLNSEENFIYSDNDNGDILDITDHGKGIAVFKIKQEFIDNNQIFPDPEHLDGDFKEEDLYDVWVKLKGWKNVTWFFTKNRIPPQYLEFVKIYDDYDKLNEIQINSPGNVKLPITVNSNEEYVKTLKKLEKLGYIWRTGRPFSEHSITYGYFGKFPIKLGVDEFDLKIHGNSYKGLTLYKNKSLNEIQINKPGVSDQQICDLYNEVYNEIDNYDEYFIEKYDDILYKLLNKCNVDTDELYEPNNLTIDQLKNTSYKDKQMLYKGLEDLQQSLNDEL